MPSDDASAVVRAGAVVQQRSVVRWLRSARPFFRVDVTLYLFFLVRGDIDQHPAAGPAARIPAASVWEGDSGSGEAPEAWR